MTPPMTIPEMLEWFERSHLLPFIVGGALIAIVSMSAAVARFVLKSVGEVSEAYYECRLQWAQSKLRYLSLKNRIALAQTEDQGRVKADVSSINKSASAVASREPTKVPGRG